MSTTSGPLVPRRLPPTSRPLSFPSSVFRSSFGRPFPSSIVGSDSSSRYAPLPPLPMNPNDSPRRSAYGGADQQPQSSGGFNPMIASPVVSRRDFGGYAPHPQQGKMLLDPQTGQQYFVPNVASQPVHAQVAYYPVFYNAPPPQPQPQALFYAAPAPHPHQQQSWAGGMPQSPPIQTAHQSNFFAAHPFYPPNGYPHHTPPQHPTVSTAPNSTPYHVEIPPSSATSVIDEPNGPSSFFRRNHDGRLSTESAGSERNVYAHSDDSMSPRVPQKPPSITAHPPQLMENSARYSTASSSTTSGFASASGAGEGPADFASIGRPAALRPAVQRAQLHGFPEWWGEEEEPKAKEDRTPTRNSSEAAVKPSASAPKLEPGSNSPTAETARSAAANSGIQKAIRMDFDLKTSAANVEQAKQEPRQEPKVPTPRVAPTAFTVNFDDVQEKPKRGKPALSSEVTNRRLARRSVPPTRFRESAQLPAQTPNSSDPKRYLLSKMLQGFGNEDENDGEESDDAPIVGHDGQRHEIDAISDAGTYVIEGKNRLRRDNQRAQSRPIDSQSSSSSSSSSTATNPVTQRSSTAASSTARSTMNSARFLNNSAASTRPVPTESPHFAMRRSLMKDLRDLKAQNQPKSTSNEAAATPKARSLLDPSKTTRLGVPTNARSCQTTVPATNNPQRPATTSNTSGIRRSDGGRFSMRTGGLQPPSTAFASARPSTVKNPPFRAGIAPTKKGGNHESPEMVAWLRRKAYDPRKSAAEARKMQQLKTRGESFFACRSVSYNQAHNSSFNRLLRPVGDERSNKSTDDLSHLTEELDDWSVGGSNSNLNRTVDELTQKCQRSMQLLKLCNPNAMTDSVEQLLDQMVEEQSEDGDDPMNRLQRLNDAFGALQKCLEDTNTSRTSSPRNPNISATLKQTILSPVASAPPAFDSTAGNDQESDGSPTSF